MAFHLTTVWVSRPSSPTTVRSNPGNCITSSVHETSGLALKINGIQVEDPTFDNSSSLGRIMGTGHESKKICSAQSAKEGWGLTCVGVMVIRCELVSRKLRWYHAERGKRTRT